MKRTFHGRVIETAMLLLGWPLALGFCFCYLAASVSLDIAGRLIGVWSES
jgi:hypothetical protein